MIVSIRAWFGSASDMNSPSAGVGGAEEDSIADRNQRDSTGEHRSAFIELPSEESCGENSNSADDLRKRGAT